MQKGYIQLPPLPTDIDTTMVEIIWLFAKMETKDQEMVHDFLKNMVDGPDRKLETMEFSKVLQGDMDSEVNPVVEEFIELLRKLLGEITVQSCELAGLVYQKYCVEGKSAAEIARETNVGEEALQLVMQYYDRKNAAE